MKLRSRAFQLGAALALCSLAAACTQPPKPQEPTPTPVPASTSPSETQLERQTRLNFEAAEKAYKGFRGEYNRLILTGGADKPTSKMRETAAGPYLAAMTEFLAVRKKEGWRSSAPIKVVSIIDGSYSPAELVLNVCEDGSKSELLNKAGMKIRTGSIEKLTIYVRPVNGVWKIWDGQNEAVKSCAAS